MARWRLARLAPLLFLAVPGLAQRQVTTFQGVPVDGTREEMAGKLAERGFVPAQGAQGVLRGPFMGGEVDLDIEEAGGRVWRVTLRDVAPGDPSLARERFNALCSRFASDSAYYEGGRAHPIPDGEDIARGMEDGKVYSAGFHQLPEGVSPGDFIAGVTERALVECGKIFTLEEILAGGEEVATAMRRLALEQLEDLFNRSAWLVIERDADGYRVVTRFDNGYNSPTGADIP